jgi:hypothetical protein
MFLFSVVTWENEFGHIKFHLDGGLSLKWFVLNSLDNLTNMSSTNGVVVT